MEGKTKARVVVARTVPRDGYTEERVYRDGEPVPGAGVAIKYRPALQEEVADFLDDPRRFHVKARELAVKHVVGWNVAADDKPDDVAPIEAKTVAELYLPVLNWIADCVLGYSPAQQAADAKN